MPSPLFCFVTSSRFHKLSAHYRRGIVTSSAGQVSELPHANMGLYGTSPVVDAFLGWSADTYGIPVPARAKAKPQPATNQLAMVIA